MSGSFSKSFYATFIGHNCRDIVHPADSNCAKWLLKVFLYHGPVGALKFYFPICLSSLLFKIKYWNKLKTWKDFLKLTSKTMAFGYGFVVTLFTILCLEYQLCGKYFAPTIISFPTFVATLWCQILPKSLLKAEGIGLFNMYLEFLIRSSKLEFIKKLRNSLPIGTFLFSILNIFIMCGMLKEKCPNFWFSKFSHKEKISNDVTADTCQQVHASTSCRNYFLKEMKGTLKFGLGICAIKAVLPGIGKVLKNPLIIGKLLVKNFDYKLFALVMGIDGIFKFLFCNLNQRKFSKPLTNCSISSFLAGISYAFFPRYEIFTLAITNAIVMIYKSFENSLKENDQEIPKIMKIINNLPIYKIIFILSTCMLVQLRIVYPYYVNRTVGKFLSLGSNGQAEMIIFRAVSLFLGYKIE